MLSFDEKLKLLRVNSFLGDAPLALLAELAESTDEEAFGVGDFIFAASDPADKFYLLIDGVVGHPEIRENLVRRSMTRQVATPGQMFGFAAAVSGQPARVTSAICETPTRVLGVRGLRFQQLCYKYGPDGHGLLQGLVRAHAGYERILLGPPGWVSVRNAGKVMGVGHKTDIVLHDCSIEIRSGECCAVVGPSGCGKTTLVDLIAGRETLTEGAIYLDGELINWPGAKIMDAAGAIMVAQKDGLWPQISVRANLMRAASALDPVDDAAGMARVDSILHRLGLADTADRLPGDVPPWHIRCAQILRTFLRDPRVVVLDDPGEGLDAAGKAALRAFLLELLRIAGGKTFLLMTRDADEARSLATRTMLMSHRRWPTPLTTMIEVPREQDERAFHVRPPAPDASAPATVSAPPPRRTAAAQAPPGNANHIRTSLAAGRFFWSVEFIPSVDKILRDALGKLGGIAEAMKHDASLAGFAITDRVHSSRDPDPVAAGTNLLAQSGKQPLVHFSGKDRDIEDLAETLARMKAAGLENMLALTGDRLNPEPKDRRPRYLESVSAIQEAKRFDPGIFVAAALNPFKYREDDAMAQYLKLGKKVKAGADCIITQIGFDMRKYEEALFWVDIRDYRVPLVANVMPMSAPRARYIRQHQLAGVTVTDSFLALLEAEERLLGDKGASRVLRRLALQIIGLRIYGYAGIQLTGVHSAEKLSALRAQVDALADLCADRIAWGKAWEESFTLTEGGRADPVPAQAPWYMADQRTRHAKKRELWKFKFMRGVHDLAFGHGLGASLAAPIFRAVERGSLADSLLLRVEHGMKGRLFGCESCGLCRLAATQYICPETCPKGLANGACGGTTDNLCEFRDRECIHSVKYRIAKDAGKLDQLENWLIPAVPRQLRNTSSWPPHFRGEGVDMEEKAAAAAPPAAAAQAAILPVSIAKTGRRGQPADALVGGWGNYGAPAPNQETG